ncbi:hypothetical protein [Collimonas fungivorans]|uniref:hypothetical protein n=1 Tax=Collimonas fungivorans TaxID=158899 RepID=UPI0011D213DE|nr:hypothetical protein [Collimonas fungivorans]
MSAFMQAVKRHRTGMKLDGNVSTKPHSEKGVDMHAIHTDKELRAALHSIYVAQFKAFKACQHAFTKADATRMLTGLMGARPWSWRVIGITPAALQVFSDHDFKRPPRQLQRGHKQDRASTASVLYFDCTEPMPLEEFFAFFLERDETVIMTNDENKHRPNSTFPDFIAIDSKDELFPCGTLVGWQHRKAEINFLRALYAKQIASSTNTK